MSQNYVPEGCFRALLKPGQEMPKLPPEEELQKGIREGRIFVVRNGKRVEPQQP